MSSSDLLWKSAASQWIQTGDITFRKKQNNLHFCIRVNSYDIILRAMSIKICQFLWGFTRAQFDAYTFVFFCSSMGCQMDPQVEPFLVRTSMISSQASNPIQTESQFGYSAIHSLTNQMTEGPEHSSHTSAAYKWQVTSTIMVFHDMYNYWIIKIHEIINGHTRMF
jgi:hypothetical protein